MSPLSFGNFPSPLPRSKFSSHQQKVVNSPSGALFDQSLREPLNVQALDGDDAGVGAALVEVEEGQEGAGVGTSSSSDSGSTGTEVTREGQQSYTSPSRPNCDTR